MKDPCFSILVTIPDTTLLELMGEVVDHFGYRPVLCKDESSAMMALTRVGTFPVGVFDWEMSIRSFPDIFKKTLEQLPTMRRLVLINQSNRIIREALQKGDFCSYVKKPFELEVFETALTECVRKFIQVDKEN